MVDSEQHVCDDDCGRGDSDSWPGIDTMAQANAEISRLHRERDAMRDATEMIYLVVSKIEDRDAVLDSVLETIEEAWKFVR